MTPEQREPLKHRCYAMLKASGMSPETKTGRAAVQAFWIGAVAALHGETPDPFVSICLLSGRIDDLLPLNLKDANES